MANKCLNSLFPHIFLSFFFWLFLSTSSIPILTLLFQFLLIPQSRMHMHMRARARTHTHTIFIIFFPFPFSLSLYPSSISSSFLHFKTEMLEQGFVYSLRMERRSAFDLPNWRTFLMFPLGETGKKGPQYYNISIFFLVSRN